MNTKIKTTLGAALLALGLAATAQAAASSTLHIRVNINANLSVIVNDAATSTHTVTWNTSVANDKLVSPATSTVLNNSGAQTEKWQLSTDAYSYNVNGVAFSTWAVTSDSSTVGANQFSLQAVFGSSMTASCPGAAAADWDQPYAPELTTTPQTYTSATFANSSLNNDGTPNPDNTSGGANGRMFAGSRRALCWRVITPSSTDTVDPQTIALTVTATNP